MGVQLFMDAHTPNRAALKQMKKTLLFSIIDDDAFIRSIIMRILNTMSFDDFIFHFEEFEDGIQFFASKRIEEPGEHLLIIDGVMPVMDGIEILQKVKKLRNAKEIHVLMLTERKSESDIERALTLGADDYMTKPFSIKELQVRIQRLVKRMKLDAI